MTYRSLLKIISLITCLFLPIRTIAQVEAAEAELQRLMKKYEAIGLAVAVVKNGTLVYSQSFGQKNVERQQPLAKTDLFRIASISKSFSATAIFQLIEKGKLSLSDDFSKVVGFRVRNPNFPNTVITLKMVMSHTSSINDSEGYFNFDVINPDKNIHWAKCYNNYEPGKGYQYCNLNYNMIGSVIENLSGERFDRYIKGHILDPLNLSGGYWVDELDSTRFSTLYEYNASTSTFIPSPMAYNPRTDEISKYVMGQSTPVFSPTGGMKITATDLATYMAMHMFQGKYKGVRIISKKSARMMQTKISEEEGYGLAIRTVSDLIPGKVMKGHTGSAYGLYSMMFFQPKDKFGIVVMTNGCLPTYLNGYNAFLAEATRSLYDFIINDSDPSN